MEYKSCCITGHRNFSGKDEALIRQKIKEETLRAIQDGYTVFISGFADGADLLFAQIVTDLKREHRIFLEAALPYASRLKNPAIQPLLKQCNGITVVCEVYSPGCFMLRNRYMVNQSHRVIAVYDGRPKGGTVFTMRYAFIMERDVRIISI